MTPKKVQTVRLDLERKSFPDFRGMFPGVKNEMKFVSLELLSGLKKFFSQEKKLFSKKFLKNYIWRE